MRPPRAATGSLCLLLIACAPKGDLPIAGSPDSAVASTSVATDRLPAEQVHPVVDPVFRYSYADRDAFLAAYPGLSKVGEDNGVLLYPSAYADRIDKRRSELPEGHPLYKVAGDGPDDIVYIRIRFPGPDTTHYYVVYTDGWSGDPAFYLVHGDSHDTEQGWGMMAEALVIPESGPLRAFQRTNAMFAWVKDVEVSEGKLVDLPAPRYQMHLHTVALAPFTLSAEASDPSAQIRVEAGDSVVVIEADSVREGIATRFLVASPTGARGWVDLPITQCPSAVIRGICGLGD